MPAVALRLWMDPRTEGRSEFTQISQEARVFAESLTDPYFSAHPMFDSAGWFEAAVDAVRSLVYLPLRADAAFGLVVLGSEDPARFAADKGTLYLTRLGELVSMALRRHAAP